MEELSEIELPELENDSVPEMIEQPDLTYARERAVSVPPALPSCPFADELFPVS